MANLKSSKKDIRRSTKRRVVNQSVRTALKTYVKKVRGAVQTGIEAEVATAVSVAAKQFDKAVKRGIIHKNQAARRKSRLAKAANKAVAASTK